MAAYIASYLTLENQLCLKVTLYCMFGLLFCPNNLVCFPGAIKMLVYAMRIITGSLHLLAAGGVLGMPKVRQVVHPFSTIILDLGKKINRYIWWCCNNNVPSS